MSRSLKVIITFHSAKGHTRKIAELIEEGVRLESNCAATLLDVSDLEKIDWAALHEADCIIFGAPTFMGSVSATFKAFIDATAEFWLEEKWANKIAAGFTVGGGQSGDKLATLIQLAIFASQHGMIWVSQNQMASIYTNDGQRLNEAVSHLGFMATDAPNKAELITPQDQESARIFGFRLAKATRRWNAAFIRGEIHFASDG